MTEAVHLAYHWQDLSGRNVIFDGQRTVLGWTISYGQGFDLDGKVTAPPAAGVYTLVWDMVRERVAWFESRGSPPLRVIVTVSPP